MVLEDKESANSQETLFASTSDRIRSENADFVSGLTTGNILGTNKSWWERKGTEKVGKMVLKGWTSKHVRSQQMSDSHVLLSSKASACILGGSDHGSTSTDIPEHRTRPPSHQHKPAPFSRGNGNAELQGCGAPCVLIWGTGNNTQCIEEVHSQGVTRKRGGNVPVLSKLPNFKVFINKHKGWVKCLFLLVAHCLDSNGGRRRKKKVIPWHLWCPESMSLKQNSRYWRDELIKTWIFEFMNSLGGKVEQ